VVCALATPEIVQSKTSSVITLISIPDKKSPNEPGQPYHGSELGAASHLGGGGHLAGIGFDPGPDKQGWQALSWRRSTGM